MPGFQVTDKPHFPSRLPCNTSSRRDYVLSGLGKLFSHLATEQFWEYAEKDGDIEFRPDGDDSIPSMPPVEDYGAGNWSIFYVPRFMSTKGEIPLFQLTSDPYHMFDCLNIQYSFTLVSTSPHCGRSCMLFPKENVRIPCSLHIPNDGDMFLSAPNLQ
jgi:hypothetical protein